VNFLKEQWNRLIDFLQDVPWLRVIVVLLMVACSVQICLWIRDTVDTNARLKIAVDTATRYAGELEKENQAIREKALEAAEDPEVWGLRIIAEVISPRVNILASGIPPGKEKAVCKAAKEVLRVYSEVVVADPKAQKLMSQQRSFLIRLIQTEQEFIITTCNQFKIF
jgi:hypothetical protein